MDKAFSSRTSRRLLGTIYCKYGVISFIGHETNLTTTPKFFMSHTQLGGLSLLD